MSLPACLTVTILPPTTYTYGAIPVQTRYDLPLTFPNLLLELYSCDCFSFKEHLEGKEDDDSGSLVQGNCHEFFNWSLFHEAVLGLATC